MNKIKEIKEKKQVYFKKFINDNNISYMNNSEYLLEYIKKYDINSVVVTNTNKENCNLLKKKLNLLNNIKYWITREDYKEKKPSSECYELALKKYKKNEKHIIGFENTLRGYNSLNKITKKIYLICNKNSLEYLSFKNIECFKLDDYRKILN